MDKKYWVTISIDAIEETAKNLSSIKQNNGDKSKLYYDLVELSPDEIKAVIKTVRILCGRYY